MTSKRTKHGPGFLWTPADDKRLRAAYAAGGSLTPLQKTLRRTASAISKRAAFLGLQGTHERSAGWREREWTEAEEARLHEAYGKVDTHNLGRELDRSVRSIYSRAHVLGLQHPHIKAWSADERGAMEIAHRRGIALSDLVHALGRNYAAVAKRCDVKGFRFGQRPRCAEPLTLAAILALDDPAVPLPPAREQRRGRSSGPAAPRQWEAKPPPPRIRRRPVLIWDRPERREPFIAALRTHGTVALALAEIGLSDNSRKEYFRARERDPAFGEQCDQALRDWQAAKVAARIAASKAATARAKRATAVRPGPRPRPQPPKLTAVPSRRPAAGAPARPTRAPTGDWRDGVDWEAARRLQKVRRAARTAIENSQAAGTTLKQGGPGAFFLRRATEEAHESQRRMADPVEQAKTVLQRRGRVVYRASVTGGRRDRWFVSGLGSEVTDEQLVAEAERLAA